MATLHLAVSQAPTRRRVEFVVPGIAQPQGSNRAFRHPSTGRVIVMSANSATLRPWRLDVKTLAAEAMAGGEPFLGPVQVQIIFGFPRPGHHFGRRKGQPYLKVDAPHFSSVRPDLDKLARSALDSLKTAQVYRDDQQVSRLLVEKVFEEPPSAHVVVEEL